MSNITVEQQTIISSWNGKGSEFLDDDKSNIEYRYLGCNEPDAWSNCGKPMWAFGAFEYRVKPNYL